MTDLTENTVATATASTDMPTYTRYDGTTEPLTDERVGWELDGFRLVCGLEVHVELTELQSKMFCADPVRDIFALRGIDRARGALVLVRPDQYVAQVLPIDAHAALAGALDAVFLPQGAATEAVTAR